MVSRTRSFRFAGTGLEILEQGADQRWEEEGGRRGEYLDLDLRLNIVLLQQAWHAVSVLDPRLDHPMRRYMERLASRGDWPTSVRLRQALAGRATPHEAGRLILNPARFSASLRWRHRCPHPAGMVAIHPWPKATSSASFLTAA